MSKVLDAERIKLDFPIFSAERQKPLIYLDSAATSQKPKQVIDAVSDCYRTYNANIHRGVYRIAEQATEHYIESKQKVERLINAESFEQIIYTRNTTESINLVALSWASRHIKQGDHILISQMEHHSNIVPWQVLAKNKGAVIDYIELDKQKSCLSTASLEAQLDKNPKLVAITHVSNVLGTINDIVQITKKAHQKGAKVLVDAAQSVPHFKVDVKHLGCDFLAFSSHKMLGPAGIGILYAKREILEDMEPLLSGGDMIKSVKFDQHEWNELPWKFEAGTSNLEGAIGLSAAIDYLNKTGLGSIAAHEAELTRYALDALGSVKDVTVYGLGTDKLPQKSGVISFAIDGVHPHDVAQIFDSSGVAIRAGHHCAQPLVTQVLNVSAVSRMSFYLYNTAADVDKAIDAIGDVKKIFKIG